MWSNLRENLKDFFTETVKDSYVIIILEFLLLIAAFYYLFKVLKANKSYNFIYIFSILAVVLGFVKALVSSSSALPDSAFYALAVIIIAVLLFFTVFSTEIKRMSVSFGVKKRKGDHLTVSGVELIIEETVRAVQNMSKKDIGALIVLSNDNLPEGIIESGTVINADINAEMIEAVFYPKAPLHDGAMIIEGNKIYAAGCFLPIIQNENLPQEMGSRHRAALGVTTVANVTVIVVSEETGIISIVKNGAVRKKYADAADLKNALSDYYWSDLTAEGKI